MANIVDHIISLAKPIVQTMGLELLYVEEASEAGTKIVRIYLDRPGGLIAIEDCEKLNRQLNILLDSEESEAGSYSLEVSSPGLNRPLVKLEHFKDQLNAIIQVTTREEVDGRKSFKGQLLSVDDTEAKVEIQVDQKVFWIPLIKIKKANLDFFASEKLRKVK